MTGLCHVTVRGGGRGADVALAAEAPVAELLPVLTDLFGVGTEDGRRPWALARVGEAALPSMSSLAAAGVEQGDVLYLVDADSWRAPAAVELDAGTGQRGGDGPRRFADEALLTAPGTTIVLIGVVLAVATRTVLGPWAAAVLASGIGLVVGTVALPPGRPLTAMGRTAMAVCGWALCGLGGWEVNGPPSGSAGLAAPALAVAVAAAATYQRLPVPSAAAAVAATGLGGAATAIAHGVPPASAATLAMLAGVFGLRLLTPLLSLLLASSTSRLDPAADRWTIAARSRQVRMVMASVSAALVAIVVGALPALLAAGVLGLAVSLVATLALALRGSSYRYVGDVLPVAAGAGLAGLAVETAAGLRLLGTTGDPTALAAGLAVTGLILVAASAGSTRLPSPPMPARAGWLLVDLLLLPLSFGVLGVLDGMARLVHHVLG